MTKMEKVATVIGLLELLFLGYVKYMVMTKVINAAIESGYFEKEAKRVAARQRQKFYENMAEPE